MDMFSIFDQMDEGIQVITPEFKYHYVNKEVAKQAKSSVEDLLGFTMMEKFPGIEKTKMFGLLKKAMKEREGQQLENEFHFPDGSIGYFELRMIPVTEGVLILSFDVTDRIQLEEKLKKMERKFGKETKSLPGKIAESLHGE